MKVIEETINKGKSRKEVLQIGKKRFIRIASERGVDWRRAKTNHQVKKFEFENLEIEYQNRFPLHFAPLAHIVYPGVKIVAPGIPTIEDDKERRRVERGLLEASSNGVAKLAGVKYVKEQTGWGLKDSKEFVENFFERRKIVLSGL